MTKTLPITQARANLAQLIEDAQSKLSEFVVTVNGSPAAVIISVEEYESWKETIDIMANPELMQAIKKGEQEMRKNKAVSFEEFKKELTVASDE